MIVRHVICNSTLLGKKRKKKCNTLEDCVHWLQGIICAYWGVVVLAIHLSRSSAIRWHSWGLSLCTLFSLCRHQLRCFDTWTVFATFTLGYNHPLPMSMYSYWTTSAICTGSHCRMLDAHSNDLLHMMGTVVHHSFHQWSVEHSQTSRPGSGRPSSTDAHPMHCATAVATRTAFREEIWAHVAPTVSPRTIGNHLLAAGLTSRMPLASLPLTPWHC